jgi:hypothetical protein
MITFDQAFVDRIRKDSTAPPKDVLTDAQILERAADVVREMNDKLRNRVLRSFTTIAEQQAYDVNAVTIQVVDLWRESTVSAVSGLQTSIDVGGLTSYVMGMAGSDSGVSMWEYPSLFLEWTRKMKAGKNIAPQEYLFAGKQILLAPPPAETGKYCMYVSIDRFTEQHIPAAWEYIVRWGVLDETLRIVARKRWNEAGVNSSGGLTTYSPQAFLVKEADENRKRFTEGCEKLSMMNYDLRGAA